jgi:hypothetical protein
MILLIDNYDVFRITLSADRINQSVFRVVRNDAMTPEEMFALNPAASSSRRRQAGGRGRLHRRDCTLGGKMPILGVLPRASGDLRGVWRDGILR